MKGQKWVGVILYGSAELDVVYRLFDRAVYSGEQRGYAIMLNEAPVKSANVYQDTVPPPVGAPLPVTDEKIPRQRGISHRKVFARFG